MSRRLLPLVPDAIHVCEVVNKPECVVICGRMKPGPVACPICGTRSTAYHGRYDRTLADLPWQGRPVQLRLRLRRFTCRNSACHRQTFCERLDATARPFARRSERRRDVQRQLGLALGGEAAERLSHRLGLPTSADIWITDERREMLEDLQPIMSAVYRRAIEKIPAEDITITEEGLSVMRKN